MFPLSRTFPDRYAVQIVAGKEKTRHGDDGGLRPLHTFGVTETVLRKRAAMTIDGQRSRPAPSPQNLAEFAGSEVHEKVVGKGGRLRIASAAQECREPRLVSGRAGGKDRGIPQAAERPNPLAGSDEKAETTERM